MKIAVIGSGPAAAATCLGLCDADLTRKLDITVIDIGRTTGRFSTALLKQKPKWGDDVYQSFHRAIRKAGKGWIPEKTYFGDFPRRYTNQASLHSDVYGGLSKFWGASFIPFTKADLTDWPLDEEEMSVYYRKVLYHVPIAGSMDKMGDYFSCEWVNQPPIRVPKRIKQLQEKINSDRNSSFIAGGPRLALRNSGSDGCTYCGHCFYGCYNHSIYSSDQTLDKLMRERKIKYVRNHQLIRFEKMPENIKLLVKNATNGELETQYYDKIYIAAGCIETSRIVSNSLSIPKFEIVENPMFQVPIFYSGRVDSGDESETIALNNLLIGRLPGEGIDKYVHMQIYPLNVYLWKHALTKAFGNIGLKLSDLAHQTVGKHVCVMLFYLHGNYTKGSTLQFNQPSSDLNLNFIYKENVREQSSLLLKQLSQLMKGSGFHILSKFASAFAPGGSYHYASTLPMTDAVYFRKDTCEIVENVHITDSSTFPSLPAQNLSFTAMANAYRIAEQSLLI